MSIMFTYVVFFHTPCGTHMMNLYARTPYDIWYIYFGDAYYYLTSILGLWVSILSPFVYWAYRENVSFWRPVAREFVLVVLPFGLIYTSLFLYIAPFYYAHTLTPFQSPTPYALLLFGMHALTLGCLWYPPYVITRSIYQKTRI